MIVKDSNVDADSIVLKQKELDSIRNVLLGTVSALLAFGLVLVYSASAIKGERFGWTLFFVQRQCMWLGVGTCALLLGFFIDYRRWFSLRWLIITVSFALLGAVSVGGLGTKVNGAQRWIRIAGISIQPSEIAKVMMVIAMAALLSNADRLKNRRFRYFVMYSSVAILTAGLIAIEPDMGTAALIGLVLFLMIFSSGARKLHIFLCAVLIMPAVGFYVCNHLDYVLKRIYAWLEGGSTGKAYHAYMSTQSMASGGLTGVGPGRGWAKLWYLPEAHTDFIFAVAGQEFGLVGTAGIVLAFMVIAYCGIKIIRLVNDTFASQLAFGITMLICLQAAFNIAVVTATTPTKGISLPFVSFGGSGLVCSMFAIGVMASVTRNAFRPQLQLIKGKASDSAWSAHILRAA